MKSTLIAAALMAAVAGAHAQNVATVNGKPVPLTRVETMIQQITKNGQPHEVPLSAPAAALLDGLPRQEGNPYIFPGRKEETHLESIRGPWDRVRVAAGVADARLHDLRRTVGSWLAQSGNSLHLIGRVLNHANQSTTAIYARFAQDHVRDALDQHAARILGAAGKLPSAEVTDIEKARAAKAGLAEFEAERFDEVQPRSGIGAQPNDVAGIGRNFRMYQDDLEHLSA